MWGRGDLPRSEKFLLNLMRGRTYGLKGGDEFLIGSIRRYLTVGAIIVVVIGVAGVGVVHESANKIIYLLILNAEAGNFCCVLLD